jgi:hypothetical protein
MRAESHGFGGEKEPSVHDKRCALSLKDTKTCKCKCGGSLHGSAWKTETLSRPSTPRASSSQNRAGRAILTLAIAVTVGGTIGGVAITGGFNASSNGGDDLSVQVNVDLDKAISALSSLGFGGRQTSNIGASGAGYPTGCADSATGQVKEFLVHYPCVQYTAKTWTITRRGVTSQVVFSWVEMPTSFLASHYKVLVDTYSTGNPPGVSSAFNGRCYASGQQDSTVWTVEVQPTGNLDFDRMILQASARGPLSGEYLEKHCII